MFLNLLNRVNTKLLILIVGRVLQILIALVAIKLATKYLNASEMGNYYLIVSIASFFGLFLVGPVGQYINRQTHKWYKEKNLLNVLYLYNFYIVALSIFSMSIIYLLNYLHIGNSIDSYTLSIVFILYIIAHTWNQTIIPLMNMLEYRIAFVVFTVLSQLLFLLLSYIFITFFSPTGVYWFLGQAVGFLIVALIAMSYFIKKIQNNFSIKNAHQMIIYSNIVKVFKFSLPLAIGAFFFWGQSQSYPLLIEKYLGTQFLGNFGVGMSVAFAISSAFESIIMQYIYPKMYESMHSNGEFSRTISKIINLILPIYFLLAIFVSIFAIFINAILVDEKYFSSYVFVAFGIWIAFFRMASNLLANIAHSQMKTKTLIFPNFIGAVLTFVGIFIAVKSNNYQLYIPIALLFSSFISFCSMYFTMYKMVPITLKIKSFFVVMLYSLPFLTAIWLYTYSHSEVYSIITVSIFGLYFVLILYLLIKRGNSFD